MKSSVEKFIHKMDKAIINVFNKSTDFIQKKGLMPLNTLIMIFDVMFWNVVIVHSYNLSIGWGITASIIGAVFMMASFLEWQNAQGYWENHRKTQLLNSLVSLNREIIVWRMLALISSIIFTTMDAITQTSTSLLGSALVLAVHYTRCCRFIGPGEYSKEKKTYLSGIFQEN